MAVIDESSSVRNLGAASGVAQISSVKTYTQIVSDGTSREFGPGDLVLATDTGGRGHITFTVGDPPFEALIIPA